MCHRFCGEYPRTFGNSFRISADNRSTTARPQPSLSCRLTIIFPISQYRLMSSLLAESATLTLAVLIRALISSRTCGYPSGKSTDDLRVSELFNDLSRLAAVCFFCHTLVLRSSLITSQVTRSKPELSFACSCLSGITKSLLD